MHSACQIHRSWPHLDISALLSNHPRPSSGTHDEPTRRHHANAAIASFGTRATWRICHGEQSIWAKGRGSVGGCWFDSGILGLQCTDFWFVMLLTLRYWEWDVIYEDQWLTSLTGNDVTIHWIFDGLIGWPHPRELQIMAINQLISGAMLWLIG